MGWKKDSRLIVSWLAHSHECTTPSQLHECCFFMTLQFKHKAACFNVCMFPYLKLVAFKKITEKREREKKKMRHWHFHLWKDFCRQHAGGRASREGWLKPRAMSCLPRLFWTAAAHFCDRRSSVAVSPAWKSINNSSPLMCLTELGFLKLIQRITVS